MVLSRPVQLIFNFIKRRINVILKNMSTEEPIVIKEGQAEILVKKDAHVFYNPVQEFNRDLSVAVLRVCTSKFNALKKPARPSVIVSLNEQEKTEELTKIRILEALSATGLRSIRYAKEVPGLAEVVANDLSKSAVEHIQANIERNGVSDIVKTSHGDAV